MADPLPRVQLGDRRPDLPKLPLLGLHIGGDGLRRKKGLRAFGLPGQGLQSLFRPGVDPYGEGLCHGLCSLVYIFAQRSSQCRGFWLSRSEYRFNPEMIWRVNVMAIIFPPAG